MTLTLRQIRLPVEVPEAAEMPEAALRQRVAEYLGLREADVTHLRVVRRSLDARHKPRVRWTYTVAFDVPDEEALLRRHGDDPNLAPEPPAPRLPPVRLRSRCHALVVGMGPAGLFAALRLAEAGAQVTLVERGRPVEQRVRDAARFWRDGTLDPESNLQFGEGGAGTFSDGKLSSRIRHPAIRHVLETLVACGAPERILTDAKPHVGTDRLRRVIRGLRERLRAAGVALRYETRLTGIALDARGRVAGGVLNDGAETLEADALLLAPGHSARDTYALLAALGVALAPKAFAVGVRVEHPAALIHRIQYGRGPHPNLPPAEYALTFTDRRSGRAVYSFCMCPGGEVVIAPSEPGHLVVNGMSPARRDGDYSNAALVVTVRPEDFDPNAGVLAGVAFARRWERAAFRAGGRDYRAPAQNLLAFLGRGDGPVRATARPGVRPADLRAVLPPFVTDALQRALPQFDRKMRGFVTREAVLLGVESRTSAPVRILRGDDGQSLTHPGLYPAGEGAGYAGGIVSSAVDGIRQADRLIAAGVPEAPGRLYSS